MLYRSKAPLRLGFAGGGTDVSPYSDEYGGYILNAAIDLYAYCTIEVTNNNKITFHAVDRQEYVEYESTEFLEPDGTLDLHKGVYNRIVKDFNNGLKLSFKMTTYADAPAGSGIGSSSTIVVVMLTTFVEWLNLPLGEYDMAHLAFEIERIDLGFSGGRQDQYAATFGGFNYMEFYANDRVIVNPLRIKDWIINELESSMLLYFTGASRESALIIEEQKRKTIENDKKSIEAMHSIKEDARIMKESVLTGDIALFARTLNKTWESKKKMASLITNDTIDKIYNKVIKLGAYAGKVSGAGGGGFMIFIVDPIKKMAIKRELDKNGGMVMNFHFVKNGVKSWKM